MPRIDARLPRARLLVVVRARPAREADRLVREFVEGLLHEYWTGQAMVDPDGRPAADRDRRDARVGLEVGRGLPARAVGAEGGGEAGRTHGARAGEAHEDVAIRMRRK